MPVSTQTIAQIAVLAGLVIIFWGVLVWRDRRSRRRLDRLRDEIDEITQGEVFHERVSLSGGNGTVSTLEASVNRLLDVVHGLDRRLMRREELFRNLSETIDQGIVVHRRHILYANPKLAGIGMTDDRERATTRGFAEHLCGHPVEATVGS